MATCLSCEAEIVPGEVDQGETLICDECGAEHEVLSTDPLELALIDDEDLEDEDDEEDEEEEDDDEDDYDEEDEDY